MGKTTLARDQYGRDLRYLNFDSSGERDRIATVPTEAWAETVGPAILDEAQKAPAVFEKVKWAYDEGRLDFSVLLGSSRILLLDRVRESLAGRVFLFELWPLTISELAPFFGGTLPEPENSYLSRSSLAMLRCPSPPPGATCATWSFRTRPSTLPPGQTMPELA